MSTTYIFIAVVVIMVIMGVIIAPIFSRRERSERLHNPFGTDNDQAVNKPEGTRRKHK
jgi:hypothetical protein